MHNSSDAGPVAAMPADDICQLITADLRNLIGRVETSIRLIDAAMTEDATADPLGSADVFVLDDVTPGYVAASAALDACRAGLGLALQCLAESGISAPAATARQRRPHLIA